MAQGRPDQDLRAAVRSPRLSGHGKRGQRRRSRPIRTWRAQPCSTQAPLMQFLHPAKGPASAPLGQRPAQQPVPRRSCVRAMAGAEGERPASPAPEAAASPEQAKPAAQEPKKATISRVPSIPVATRPNDGVGERPPPLPRRGLQPALYRPHPLLHRMPAPERLANAPWLAQNFWRFGTCAASSSRRTHREWNGARGCGTCLPACLPAVPAHLSPAQLCCQCCLHASGSCPPTMLARALVSAKGSCRGSRACFSAPATAAAAAAAAPGATALLPSLPLDAAAGAHLALPMLLSNVQWVTATWCASAS